MLQSMNSTMNRLCGKTTFDVSAQIGESPAEFKNGTNDKVSWNLNSTSDLYTFSAYLNFPDYSWWGQATE